MGRRSGKWEGALRKMDMEGNGRRKECVMIKREKGKKTGGNKQRKRN